VLRNTLNFLLLLAIVPGLASALTTTVTFPNGGEITNDANILYQWSYVRTIGEPMPVFDVALNLTNSGPIGNPAELTIITNTCQNRTETGGPVTFNGTCKYNDLSNGSSKDGTWFAQVCDNLLSVIACDFSNNTWINDHVNPATSFLVETNEETHAIIVDLSSTDAVSGVDFISYCVDTTDTCAPDTEVSGDSTPVIIPDVALGEVWFVRFHATDLAGNQEEVQSTGQIVLTHRQISPSSCGGRQIEVFGIPLAATIALALGASGVIIGLLALFQVVAAGALFSAVAGGAGAVAGVILNFMGIIYASLPGFIKVPLALVTFGWLVDVMQTFWCQFNGELLTVGYLNLNLLDANVFYYTALAWVIIQVLVYVWQIPKR